MDLISQKNPYDIYTHPQEKKMDSKEKKENIVYLKEYKSKKFKEDNEVELQLEDGETFEFILDD